VCVLLLTWASNMVGQPPTTQAAGLIGQRNRSYRCRIDRAGHPAHAEPA
jgi:hypothetical protein